jgi:uncharacterized membrane protein
MQRQIINLLSHDTIFIQLTTSATQLLNENPKRDVTYPWSRKFEDKSMLNPTKSLNSNFLITIMLLQSAVYIIVFFNIPIARQVLGFLYFTFLPGLLIVKLLGFDKFGIVDTIVFSVGFSLVFLMIIGLLINESGLLLGFSRSLSSTPLLIIFNSLILVIGAVIHLRNGVLRSKQRQCENFSRPVLLLLIPAVLSIAGAMLVNINGSNLVLLCMLVAISLLLFGGIIPNKLLPSKQFAFAVLIIAISLLYSSALISKYVVTFGSDVPFEYFVFRTTADSAHWSSTLPSTLDPLYGRLNAMLSITILPTIYLNLLNMDPTFVFKMLFPLILSFVPLILYRTWEMYIGKKYALVSAFLFMSQATFFTEMLGLNRQIIGELFFALLFLVILNKKIDPARKFVCFVLFGFGLVVSHYALAEIFLFFTLFAVMALLLLRRPSRKITLAMATLFFVIMFSWYIYTSSSTVFDSFLSFGDQVYHQLGEFTNPASRGETVLAGLGLGQAPTIWNLVSRGFAYVTEAFIIIGFIGLILKRTKAHFELEYFLFNAEAIVLLVALVAVPGLANTLNMTRFYHILLFFLAPLCVLGAEVLAKFVSKHKTQIVTSVLLLSVLIPYFFFQTGFVYEITGSESWSLPLSMYRMEGYKLIREMGTIPGQNVYSALWLSKFVDVKGAEIYADLDSINKALIVYGLIPPNQVNVLSNSTKIEADGVIYLGQLNVVYGLVYSGSILWNSSERSSLFGDVSQIYSNGGCEIYENTSPSAED